MITENTLYWITRLDYISNFLIGAALFMIIPMVFCIGSYCEAAENRRFAADRKEAHRLKGIMRKSIIGLITSSCIALILWIACVFTPSTKELCMIKVIPMLVNSEAIEQLNKDGKEIYELGVKRIKEELIGGKE